MDLQTLSVDEVIRIHEVIAAEFAQTKDPISPSGVRSRELLESAVGRQHTGSGRVLKYPDPISNAATLLYGICCDHPFLNGNKRTALIVCLAHLDRNRYALYNTSQDDLYQLMLEVAKHTIGLRDYGSRRDDQEAVRRHSDEEVAAISTWLKERAERLRRGERQISYRQMRAVLEPFGFILDNPHDNTIEVLRKEVRPPSLLRRKPSTQYTRVGKIGYRDEGTEMALSEIKKLRKMCKLTEEDGVDSDGFYDSTVVVDAFVNRYRTVLRRLART